MGWALTISGAPYVWTTQQHGAIVAAHPDWPQGGPAILRGHLIPPTGSFTERMRPLDGDLDVDDLTLRLYDPVVSVGPASGYNVVTWLGTRKASSYTATELASDLTADGTGAFTVSSGTGLPTGPAVVHVDRESILIDSRSGTTLTPNAYGRGWYGTRALPHARDPSNSYAPALFEDFTTFKNRLAILWHVDDNDVAVPIWRGYVTRGPRFSGGGEGADGGTVYELQCTHAWGVEREVALGIPGCATRLRGYHSDAIHLKVSPPSGVSDLLTQSGTNATINPAVFDTFEGAAAHSAARLRDNISDAGYAANYTIGDPHRDLGKVKWKVVSTGVGALTVAMRLGDASGSATNDDRRTFLFITSFNSADPRTAEAEADFVVPPLMFKARGGGASQTIPVASTFGFPSSWSATTYTDGPHTTTVQNTLRADWGDDVLVIEPTSISTDPPEITGTIRALVGPWYGYLDQAIPFVGATKVATTHWVYGLRNGVFQTGSTTSGADPRNWDWTYAARLAQATEALPSARTWLLDGTQKLGEFVVDLCAVNGCGLAVRDSRLCAVPYEPALATAPVAATFDADDLIDASFEPLEDGVANVIELDSDTVQLVVRDQRSIARFGQGRTVSLRLTGTEASAIGADPSTLAQHLLARVIDLWSNPVSIGRFTTSWASLRSVRLGDTIEVTEWLLPRGDGTRGLTDQRLLVIGRTVNFDEATVTFEGVAFDEGRPGGYAPCVRVAAAPDEFTIEVAAGYLNAGTGIATTVSDYAGSDADEYTGTADDGGANWYAVGDKVRLIVRDQPALETSALTIADIYESGGSWFVEFTGSMGSALEDHITGGSMVDLIPDEFSATTTDQRAYCAVGDNNAPATIDGTGVAAFTFAP
jgi:hypothetical protein